MSKVETIQARQDKQKQALLEQLRRLPIKEVAYEKVGITRMTASRWRNISQKFAEEMDSAMKEGREFICDLAESQVISLIRQGKLEAARLYLQYNNPRYANKLELTGNAIVERPMTPVEKALLKQAFKHSSLYVQEKPKEKSK